MEPKERRGQLEFFNTPLLTLLMCCILYLKEYAFVPVIYSVYAAFAKSCLVKTVLNKIVRNATTALHGLFNSINDKQC